MCERVCLGVCPCRPCPTTRRHRQSGRFLCMGCQREQRHSSTPSWPNAFVSPPRMSAMMMLSSCVILRLPCFVSTLYRCKRAKCHAEHRFFLFSFEKDGAPCRTALPPQRYEFPSEERLLARDYFIYVRANNILPSRFMPLPT